MARATYQCPKCGMPVTVSRGNRRDTDSYAAWCQRQGRVCFDCSKAALQEEHRAKVAAAAADPLTAILPALMGTEKQVSWAQALRLEALPKIAAAEDALCEESRSEPGISDVARAELSDAIHLLAKELRDRTEAKSWIDTRTFPYEDVIATELRKRLATLCPTAHAEKAADA